jgi:hypothetical protein
MLKKNKNRCDASTGSPIIAVRPLTLHAKKGTLDSSSSEEQENSDRKNKTKQKKQKTKNKKNHKPKRIAPHPGIEPGSPG